MPLKPSAPATPRIDPASASDDEFSSDASAVAQRVHDAERAVMRIDPESRHVDGGRAALSWNALVNKDPETHYVWAYLNHPETGLEYYLALGFEVCRWNVSADGEVRGVRPAAGRVQPDGTPIEQRGHVLVECSLSRKAELDQFGESGSTGQKLVDKIESGLQLRNKLMADPLRGVSRRLDERYLSIQGDKFDNGVIHGR